MEPQFAERRRHPRVAVNGAALAMRPVSMAVRLLDLSSGGVLLACPDRMRVGATPRVVARLGGAPLEAQLHVRHASDQWDKDAGGFRIGAFFTSVSPLGAIAIDELLKGSSR